MNVKLLKIVIYLNKKIILNVSILLILYINHTNYRRIYTEKKFRRIKYKFYKKANRDAVTATLRDSTPLCIGIMILSLLRFSIV